jgi:uncharacterized protein (UPF0335 family)
MAKMNTVTTQPKVENTTPEVERKAEINMDAILERLDRLEKENDELRAGKMNVFTEGRKVYD